MKPKPLTISDLPANPARGLFLCCSRALCVDRALGNRYSATRGDYFMARPTLRLTCNACHAPLILAREEKRIVKVEVSA
jgi:hypothetical protein